MKTNFLQERVHKNLELFYQQRAERLKSLTLDQVLAVASENLWSAEEMSAPGLLSRLIEEYLTGFEQWWRTLLKDKEFCLQANGLRTTISTPQFSYQDQLAFAHNRLTLNFIRRFCGDDGAIDWSRLLHFNSGAD